MNDAHVLVGRRTPFTRLDGALAHLDEQALAQAVVRAVMEELDGVAPVDDVILANAAGRGGNLARRVALAAGLPVTTPGITVDRQCGGGLDAIVLACRLVQSGAAELVIAGGAESASRSPLRGRAGSDAGRAGRRFFPRERFSAGGYDDPGMAESAEAIATERGIDRARQDTYALRSHERAVAAARSGTFDAELTPCAEVVADDCPRERMDATRLRRFAPIVRAGGTVTAGNSSQIADGAAVVAVASAEVARRLGASALRLVDAVSVGVDPRLCGLGGQAAVERLAARDPAFRPAAVAQIAFTEAFAAQVVATVDGLGLDPAIVNPAGGAIALGHPWAASGAAQVVRLWSDLRAGDGEGLAVAAIAGGMGTAARFAAATP